MWYFADRDVYLKKWNRFTSFQNTCAVFSLYRLQWLEFGTKQWLKTSNDRLHGHFLTFGGSQLIYTNTILQKLLWQTIQPPLVSWLLQTNKLKNIENKVIIINECAMWLRKTKSKRGREQQNRTVLSINRQLEVLHILTSVWSVLHPNTG